jgi:uncharacterized RDD family membrane protein YckC
VPLVLVPTGAGSRFVALAIDTCISAALISALVTSLNALLPRGISAVTGIALTSAVHWGYHVYLETRHQGRTPGKRGAGLRVIDGRGLPLTVEQPFLRTSWARSISCRSSTAWAASAPASTATNHRRWRAVSRSTSIAVGHY